MPKKPDLSNYVNPGGFEQHVTDLYREMELEMIASLKRNLAGHKGEELKAGVDYTAWQAAKLRELTRYRVQNRRMVKGYTSDIYKQLGPTLLEEFRQGIVGEKSRYAAAGGDPLQASFFAIDDRKVNALITELRGAFRTANTAALRLCNDAYRQVIFDTTLFAANGVLTEQQAFDRAIKKFTERGINCIVYSNGARHNIAEYTSMALRTAHLRANLMGAGEFRRQLGEHLIQITRHGTACPLCVPWEGKILIDDVYSGGSRADGNYPLLSEAMQAGLYHPNCRHGSGTYYPELDDVVQETLGDNAKEKAAVAHAEHQVQKFKRLAAGCLDPKLKAKYEARLREWEGILAGAQKGLHSLSNSGIIGKPPAQTAIAKEMRKPDVHVVGRINREMFEALAEVITTDEVIITDDQAQHIQDRHPEDYERFKRYATEMLDAPDFIIEANRPHSAVLLKTIAEDGRTLKLVLRLKVLGDIEDRKNSVITFMHIDEKDFMRLLRNKKVLYKRA